MTDIEFWLDLAENMEQARAMMPYSDGKARPGLCSVIVGYEREGMLDIEQSRRLILQLRVEKPPRASDLDFYWEPHVWKPRVAACRRIAQRLIEQEKAK